MLVPRLILDWMEKVLLKEDALMPPFLA